MDDVVIRAANPPYFTVYDEALVPTAQREPERGPWPTSGGLTRGDENTAEANVARLGGPVLAGENKDNWSSQLDTAGGD